MEFGFLGPGDGSLLAQVIGIDVWNHSATLYFRSDKARRTYSLKTGFNFLGTALQTTRMALSKRANLESIVGAYLLVGSARLGEALQTLGWRFRSPIAYRHAHLALVAWLFKRSL